MAGEECSICLEPVGAGGGDNHCTLPCGHAFHATCVLCAFRNTPRCPLCRSEPLPPPSPSTQFFVMHSGHRGRLDIVDMDQQVVQELEQFRRQWRNHNARANRAIRAHPQLSSARDEVRRLTGEQRSQQALLTSTWRRVERAAWNSPDVKQARLSEARASRRLRAAKRKLDTLVHEQVGEPPELPQGDHDE